MNYAERFIEDLDIKGNIVVAAISGGPDSMLLLDILLKLRNKLNIKIIVAHVHHNLRKESDIEARFVEDFCNSNNLIFEYKKIDNYPNNKFSEDTARKIRYDFFDEIVKKYNAKILFTAHHGDDLVESILMRLIRGSTLKGYAGFESISKSRGYIIARPLIYMTKSEIESILKQKDIPYCIDVSNNNDKYTRNRYRKYILPELKKENKNVHKKFIEFNKTLLLANDYLEKISDKLYTECTINNEIDVKKFNKLDDIIKIYIIEKYLKDIYKEDIILLDNNHKNIILNNILNSTNIIFDLPCNKKGIVEYNRFKIIEINYIKYDIKFTDYVKLPNGKVIMIDNKTDLTTNFVIHLSSNDVKFPLHVRTKKAGDRMQVKNMIGTKKVSDIFTDFKLPKAVRNTYPIVTDDNDVILWIPGIKKSKFDRKKDKKYDIILKYD